MAFSDRSATSTIHGDNAGMPIQLMLAILTDRRDFGDDWLLAGAQARR
jgi:hypothetical protein